MAFDMFAGEAHLSINRSEEILFQIAHENPEEFPELTRLWETFYDGPLISNEQSGKLVHELIELGESAGNEKLKHIIGRLLPFFSRAFRSSLDIQCLSD
jgi:hypothetical protein